MQRMFPVNEESVNTINKYLRSGWKIKTGGTFMPGTFVTLTLDIEELASLRIECRECQSKRKSCDTCVLAERMRAIQACTEESGPLFGTTDNGKPDRFGTVPFNPADFEEGVQL